MVDGIDTGDEVVDEIAIEDRPKLKLKAAPGLEMFDVLKPARREIIDGDDFIAPIEQ